MLEKCSAFWPSQIALENNLFSNYYCYISLLWSQWNHLKYNLFVLYWGFLLVWRYMFIFFSPLLNKVNATAWRLHIFFFLVPGEYFPILYVLKMPTWPFLRKRPWCDSLQRPHQLHFNFPLVICDRLNVLHHGCNSILVGSRVCCRVKLANRMHMLVLGDPLAAWIALPLCF